MDEAHPAPAGRVILLNGASSSGKSSLARQLQARLGVPFLHLSSDHWIDAGVVPKRREETGPFNWVTSMRPRFFDGFHRTVAAMAEAGNNLIVDHIMEYPSWRSELQHRLTGLDVFLVAVHCDVEELRRRERLRGNRHPGEALSHLQENRIHEFGPVDYSVDTTAGVTAQLTADLLTAWERRSSPSAFFHPVGGPQ